MTHNENSNALYKNKINVNSLKDSITVEYSM